MLADDEDDDVNENEDVEVEAADTNPGKNKVTITAGSMMNFVSAIKWFHKFVNAEMGKEKYYVSAEVNDELKIMTATYKRDVGEKRKTGACY